MLARPCGRFAQKASTSSYTLTVSRHSSALLTNSSRLLQNSFTKSGHQFFQFHVCLPLVEKLKG